MHQKKTKKTHSFNHYKEMNPLRILDLKVTVLKGGQRSSSDIAIAESRYNE